VEEEIRRVVGVAVGVKITDAEVAALADWYANLARSVAEFPAPDLKAVEPPLRSIAGPKA
jgi:hypothetical protein